MNAQTSRTLWIWLAPVGLALALFGGLLGVMPARAVSSFNPCVHPTGAGSCYTTIQDAVTGLASGATITIAAGIYPEHVIVGTKVLTFIGAGADSTFVDGSNTGRVFSITAPSATFAGLTIQNGHVISDSGGGIYAAGALTLTNVAIVSNTAEARLAAGGTNDGGGGVRVMGDLYVTGSRFENNSVPTPLGEGGAIRSNVAAAPHPSVHISGTVFLSNTAKFGGAISAGGPTWITNTQVASNTSTSNGGGVYIGSASPSVTLSGSTIEHNTTNAGTGGGAHIAGADLMISGCAIQYNTTLTGAGGGGVYVQYGLTVTGTHFIGNRAEHTEGAVTGSGGGLYAVNYASPRTVVDTDFISNTAGQYGGGLYTGGGPLTLTNARFISNTSYLVGGGARLTGVATVVDAEFTSNHTISSTGGSGGGIYLDNTATVTGTVFTSNAASTNGGGLYARSALTLTNSTFYSNTSAGVSSFAATSNPFNSGGGGLFAYGVATVSGSQFAGNSAAAGGGGAFLYGAATLVDAVFADNMATDYGGGLFARAGLVMTDTQLIRNGAANGGGIYVSGYTAGASRMVNVLLAANSAITNGAALYLYSAGTGSNARTATIVHTTIASPTVGASQAIFVGKLSPNYTPTVNITNTIIASYTTGISVTTGAVVNSDYNYFNHAPTAIDIGTHSISGTEHYLLFADAAADDYRPALGSPAPTHVLYLGVATDLDGNPRPVSGPSIDPPTIGAYEGTPYPNVWLTKTVTPTSDASLPAVLTYTIELSNTGSLTDTVLFTDTLPASVTFGGWVVEPAGIISTSRAMTWTGILTDLTGFTGIFTVTVTDPAATSILNTAWFSSSVQTGSAVARFRVTSCFNIEVANTNDSGPGSLRQALADACAGATITFDPALTAGGPATITLTSAQALTLTQNVTITGPGAGLLAASGNSATRVFYVDSGVAATISGLTIRDGYDGGDGGGIYNAGALTLAASKLVSNAAEYLGGGILSEGALTVTASAITSNTTALNGGGIYVQDGVLMMITSTLAGNAGGNGGGIYANSATTSTVENSTFFANRAGDGGGIYASGLLTLTNSTLANNMGGGAGTGAGLYNDGELHFRNTIISNSSEGSDCHDGGTIATSVANLVEDGSCSATFSGDPRLGALGDYGGSTLTLPLLPGSPAIDAGNAGACLATDQRGVTRTAATCDIGAFESQGFTLLKGGGDSQRTLVNAPFTQPLTLTVTGGVWQGREEPVAGGLVTLAGPLSGAGVTPITATATVTTGGAAAITVTANSAGGAYAVHATTLGAAVPLTYNLENVLPVTTTTTVTATPTSTTFGAIVTITAVVTAASGTPTGWVTFTVDGGAPLAQPLVAAMATLTRTDIPAGAHAIVAHYGGAPDFLASDSPAVTQTVLAIGTTITVTAAPNPAPASSSVTFTATVSTAPPGAGTPTGLVTFTVGTSVLTATLNGSGVAVTQTTRLISGTQAVRANYLGDGSFNPASVTGASLVVTCAPVYTVETTADAGAGSLRQALVDVCTGGTITFAPALTAGGPATITLTGAQLNVTKNLTITGPGADLLLVSGNNAHRVFNINAGFTAVISGLAIGNGYLSSGAGGGLQNAGNLTLSSTTVVSNSASQYGGGIYNTGSLTLTGATVISNTSPGDGGGVYNYQGTVLITGTTIAGNTGSSGGGLVNYGTVTVIGSTVVSNTAPGFYSGGTLYGGAGGGIFNGNGVTLTLTNATIINNTAAKTGGGLYNTSKATATNVTIVGNAASTSGGGIYNISALTLNQSSLSGNSGGGLRNTGTVSLTNTLIGNSLVLSDCTSSGTIAVNTRNLVEDGSCSPALTGDPVVGAVGDYGGPSTGSGQATWTLPLLPGSPAIDAGNAARCLATDQRGVTRTATKCDIGAYESQGFTLAKGGGSSQSTPATAPFAQPFTATIAAGTWQGKSEPVYGGQVTFVGPASGAGLAPITNTATVSDTGVATIILTANSTQGGTYSVRAFALGASPTITYTGLNNIAPATTTTTLTASAPSVVYGAVVTFTVAVTSAAGTPVGVVTFTVDSATSVQPLVNAVATLTRTDLTVGDHAIVARYGGGGGFVASTAPTMTMTVAQASTAITVTAAPNPAVVQNSVTFTATVSAVPPGGGTPTGAVTFTVGANVFTGTLTGGVAAGQRTDLAIGTYSVTAAYPGDGNYTTVAMTGADQVVTCAPVYTVDTTADADGGSLRQALVDVCAGGEIRFAPALTVSGTATITLTGGQALTLTKSMTITGPGASLLAVSADNRSRVFYVNSAVTATLAGLTLRDGQGTGAESGGAIYSEGALTLAASAVVTSTATSGGGIYNSPGGVLTVTHSTIYSNAAATNGGGILNAGLLVLDHNTIAYNVAPANGGGLYSEGAGGGVTAANNTVAYNASGNGGGLYISAGTVSVTNTTFAHNSASNSGGGIYNRSILTLTNSTLANNNALTSGGGIYVTNSGSVLNYRNTIVANSPHGGDCATSPDALIGANVANLVQDGSCSAGGVNFLTGDPLLGPLADNGGPSTGSGQATWTYALLPGSPAIDTGENTVCPATDQRAVDRPQPSGGVCDIGAFETRGFTVGASSGSVQHAAIGAAFAQPLTLTVASAYTEPVVGGLVVFTGPVSGASISPAIVTGTLAAGGVTSVLIIANQTAGSYAVSGATRGVTGSAVYSLTNDPGPTGTTLTTSHPVASVFGESVTFTATVTANPPGVGTPTGVVTFTTTSGDLGAGGLDSGGVATYTTSSLVVGAHPITATYGGDANFKASTSSRVTQTVNKATATVTLRNLSHIYDGAPKSAFTTTSPVSLTVDLTYNGVVTAPMAVGSYTVVGTVNDLHYTGASTETLTIDKATTAVALTGVPNPSVFGQSVTFTATVSVTPTGAITPTGVVTFATAAGTLGTGVLAGGVATYTASSLAAGGHAITATYGGAANFQGGASSPVNQTVNKATATVTLSNLSQTYDGTPKPATATTTPVSLTVGLTYNGVVTAPADAGSYTVVGAVDDLNYTGVSIGTLTIGKAGTTAVMTGAPNPSTFGQSVTVTATVNMTPTGAITPTGVVTFSTATGMLGTDALDATGVATYATSSLAAGDHAITATYGGDANSQASAASPVNQAVNKATAVITLSNLSQTYNGAPKSATATSTPPGLTVTLTYSGSATPPTSVGSYVVVGTVDDLNYSGVSTDILIIAKASTTVALTSAPNPSAFGQFITLTATVSMTPTSELTPTGVVTFTVSGAPVVRPLNDGVATYDTPALGISSHTVTATYGGDASFLSSISAPVSQAVERSAVVVDFAATPNPAHYGEAVSVAVTVTARHVLPAGEFNTQIRIMYPTGVVTLYDSIAAVTSGVLVDGQGALMMALPATGVHSLTVAYGGDTNHAPGVALASALEVTKTRTTITLTAPPAATVYGQAAIFTVTVQSDLFQPAAAPPAVAAKPGSQVQLKEGATLLGTGTLIDGMAMVSVSILHSGLHTVTAEYAGDGNYLASTAAAVNHTVNQATATVTLGSLSHTYDGTPKPATATTNPTGLTVTLTYAGSATPPTNVGSYTVVGTVDDLNYTGVSTDTLTIGKATTAVALTSAPNPATFGQSVTFTATVSMTPAGAMTPTGVVTFSTATGTLGTGILSNNVATFVASSLAGGDNVVTATYGGDASYRTSISPALTQTVQYTIGVSANPVAGGSVTGGRAYNHGATIAVTATANSGYTFVNWTESGNPVSTDAVYSFVATGNRTLVANFALNHYAIAVSANPATGGSVTGSGVYDHGATVAVTATANSGYTFVNWTEGGSPVSTDAAYSFTSTANRTLIANFVLNQYAIAVSANPVAGGSVTGGGVYDHGATVVVTATANAGYTFVNWTEGGIPVSTDAAYRFIATGNRTLIANFVLNQYAIAVSANPVAGGSVSGGGTYNHGATVVVTATANIGYTFVNWTEGGNPVSTDAAYNFTATGNRTLVANFTLNQYTIAVSADPVAGGSATGGGTYTHGATVVVTATANIGYTFVNWTEGGNPVSTDAVYGFTSTGNRTLVATFAPLPTAVNDAAGTLQGNAVVIHVLANDLDPAGLGLTVVAVTDGLHGAVAIAADGQSVTYTPAPAFSGTDSFTYQMRGGNGGADDALVAVVVTAQSENNEPPQVAAADPAVTATVGFTGTRATVRMTLPAGFYTGTMEIKDIFYFVYSPVVTPIGDIVQQPGGLKFGNFVFDMAAYVNGAQLADFHFAQPVTLTITYDPALLGDLREETLTIFYWNGVTWSGDGVTVVARDSVNHSITILLTHLSEFGFFASAPTALEPGEEPDQWGFCYLPLIAQRQQGAMAAPEPWVEQAPADAPVAEAPPQDTATPMLYLPLIGR